MLNRCLFWLANLVALTLVALVLLAPWIVRENPAAPPRWLLLFALDAIIRRAAVVCAVGLFVTAMVFFRNSTASDSNGNGKRPRSASSIGA